MAVTGSVTFTTGGPVASGMSQLLKQADDIRRRVESVDRVMPLGERLAELDDVESATIARSYTPPRVVVGLYGSRISDEVADALDAYDASIIPDTVSATSNGENLMFDVAVPPLFEIAGAREMRAYGEYSTSLTFPREALELSGFDVGSEVDVRATDGAILLVESTAATADE